MKHKPWFDKGFSKLLHQRKLAKLELLRDPSQINGDNMYNVRREAIRYFRNKKREYLKDKINELATNSKNKNIRDLYRGIPEFKRGDQPRNNLVKVENGDLLAESHNILNRWKNYFSQLLHVHSVNDVRQIELHTAEPLVPDISFLEDEAAIVKLKKYKSPASNQIPAELIQAEGKTLLSQIHKLIHIVFNKEELPDQWKEYTILQFIRRGIKLIVVIIIGYHCYQLHTKFYRISSSQSWVGASCCACILTKGLNHLCLQLYLIVFLLYTCYTTCFGYI
jgi:hypothetical protein